MRKEFYIWKLEIAKTFKVRFPCKLLLILAATRLIGKSGMQRRQTEKPTYQFHTNKISTEVWFKKQLIDQ